MDGWTDGRMDGWTDGQITFLNCHFNVLIRHMRHYVGRNESINQFCESFNTALQIVMANSLFTGIVAPCFLHFFEKDHFFEKCETFLKFTCGDFKKLLF
jgi:hypothetical protein